MRCDPQAILCATACNSQVTNDENFESHPFPHGIGWALKQSVHMVTAVLHAHLVQILCKQVTHLVLKCLVVIVAHFCLKMSHAPV